MREFKRATFAGHGRPELFWYHGSFDATERGVLVRVQRMNRYSIRLINAKTGEVEVFRMGNSAQFYAAPAGIDPVKVLQDIDELAARWKRARDHEPDAVNSRFDMGRAEAYAQAISLLLGVELADVKRALHSGWVQ